MHNPHEAMRHVFVNASHRFIASLTCIYLSAPLSIGNRVTLQRALWENLFILDCVRLCQSHHNQIP